MESVFYEEKIITDGAIFLSVVSTFGQNLRKARKAAGLKAYEVAEKLGVKPPVISKWENNRLGLPETPTLFRLAKAVNVSVEQLLVGIDAEYDQQRDLARQTTEERLASQTPTRVGDSNEDPAGLLSKERLATDERDAEVLREVAGRLLEIAGRHHTAEKTEDAEGAPARTGGRDRAAG